MSVYIDRTTPSKCSENASNPSMTEGQLTEPRYTQVVRNLRTRSSRRSWIELAVHLGIAGGDHRGLDLGDDFFLRGALRESVTDERDERGPERGEGFNHEGPRLSCRRRTRRSSDFRRQPCKRVP